MMSNAAKTSRLMRRLGFAPQEKGKYVAALRALVAEKIAKGDVNGISVPFACNYSNEERARIALEGAWDYDHRDWSWLPWFDLMFRNPYRVS